MTNNDVTGRVSVIRDGRIRSKVHSSSEEHRIDSNGREPAHVKECIIEADGETKAKKAKREARGQFNEASVI
jgi:hypothetical protein